MLWILLFNLLHVEAQDKLVGVFYYKNILGHVHDSPQVMAASVTTIQCNHPVKVIESAKVIVNAQWKYVEVADLKGFVQAEFLSPKKGECFQADYPRFWDGLNLDLVQLFYWGRLYDQFVTGESKIQ
jgi:hypothetical protein